MDLKIKDVATLLNISESTLRRWVTEGKIPAYKINQQYRFSRIEIDEWVMSHKMGEAGGFSPFSRQPNEENGDTIPSGTHQYSLYRAVHKGDVLFNVPGRTKEEIVRYVIKKISPNLQLDAELLSDLLLDREGLMSTALNNGVAVPHTREILFKGYYDIVTVVFPEQPVNWGALDGQPVHALFFLFACEDSRHLNLLAKVAHLSSHAPMLERLKTKSSKDQILELIKEWETQISH